MKKKQSKLHRHGQEWTQREENLLRKLYPDAINKELTERFGRTVHALTMKASQMGIRKNWREYPSQNNNGKPWSEKELKKLKKLYPVMPVSQLIAHFPKRSRTAVESKAGLLKLRKNYATSERPDSSGLNLWREQKDLLAKLYPTISTRELAEKFGRTEAAIRGQAIRIGLHKSGYNPDVQVTRNNNSCIRWSDKDIKKLRKLWQKGHTKSEIAGIMGKTYNSVHNSIRTQIQNSKLKKRNEHRRWSKEETAYLIEHYKNKTVPQISAVLGRPEGCVSGKAKSLNLTKSTKWSARDIKILKKYYKTLPARKIAEKLEIRRSERCIHNKALSLNLTRSTKWSAREIEILKKHYKTLPAGKVAEKLENRTASAVIQQAHRLGLIKK